MAPKYPRKPFVARDGSEGVADAKLSLGTAPHAWAMLHSQERRTWESIERFDEQGREFFRDEVEHIETTDKLVLAEGFETGLSAAILYDRPAWAKCSGFPAEIVLPERIRDVLIVADNDAPTKNGKPRVTSQERGKRLARFIRSTGRRCEVVVAGEVGFDANDVLLAAMQGRAA